MPKPNQNSPRLEDRTKAQLVKGELHATVSSCELPAWVIQRGDADYPRTEAVIPRRGSTLRSRAKEVLGLRGGLRDVGGRGGDTDLCTA